MGGKGSKVENEVEHVENKTNDNTGTVNNNVIIKNHQELIKSHDDLYGLMLTIVILLSILCGIKIIEFLMYIYCKYRSSLKRSWMNKNQGRFQNSNQQEGKSHLNYYLNLNRFL